MKKITAELINTYKNHLIEEEKSSLTLEKYIRDITAFYLWIGDKTIEKTDVLKYKEFLTGKYAPASINSMLSSLNSFFVYNEWFNLKVKTIRVQRQMFLREDKELTKSEYDRLLKAAKSKGNQKLYLLMQTICGTGIRVSELKFITVESLRLKRATINLKGKMRIVIIPDSLCKILLKFTTESGIVSGSVFVTREGNPIDRSTIWKMMKALCEAADVARDKVFPHNLRHLFARTFYSLQKDIVRLADILGHSSVNTTRIYTMDTGITHRTQIQKLGLLKCWKKHPHNLNYVAVRRDFLWPDWQTLVTAYKKYCLNNHTTKTNVKKNDIGLGCVLFFLEIVTN